MRVDCAEYAIAFSCGVRVDDAKEALWKIGRPIDHDGTTDAQIARAVRWCDQEPVPARTEHKTIRSFARSGRLGAFIVFTCDHVVAVVDGVLCDRPENSDLARIEKVWKII